MIGAEVSCSDGVCGEVRRVVVDPLAEPVTHLVIGPEHPRGLGRLVPVDLIDATAGEVRLRCTLAEFARLSWAKETHFLPESGVYPGYAPGQVFSWPYYGVGARLAPFRLGNSQQTVTYHSVPLGEVSMTNRQYRRCRVIAQSTWKKSVASIGLPGCARTSARSCRCAVAVPGESSVL